MHASRRILYVLSAVSIFCRAQAPTADLAGTIRDASGAVVAGAQVTAVNEQTGLKRSFKSTGLGYYSIPLLPPGLYSVDVQQQGFRGVERKGITLHIGDSLSIDFTLEVGAIAERRVTARRCA